jgi:hypothetical protein
LEITFQRAAGRLLSPNNNFPLSRLMTRLITVDGERRWAKLFRRGIGPGMAAEKRQALLDKGWIDAPTS